MAGATDPCPRCGEQERLGTWCGACGALLEEVEHGEGNDRGRRVGRTILVLVLLAILAAAIVVGLSITDVYDPFDLGIDLGL